MTDRHLFGWRVRSALPLDALAPWSGDDRAPDIAITLGPLPAGLAKPVHEGPFLTVDEEGSCLLTIAEVARYRVEGGRSVAIEPLGPVDAPDIATFLLGTVAGILCHQRGLLPLHASAVRIGDRAVAFAGISGAGKSTLAATLTARGHRLLTDDIAAIDVQAPGGPMLLPGFPRMKLWRDSLDALGVDGAALTRVRGRIDKFQLPAPGFAPDPVRLSAVYGLARKRGPHVAGIAPLAGNQAAAMLSNNVYRGMIPRLIGRQAALFGATIGLTRAVPCWALTRPDDLAGLDALARLIEKHAAAP